MIRQFLSSAIVIAALALGCEQKQEAPAASAPEGLRVLQEWRPDLLLADVEMPIEDGYSLIAKVRALPPEAGGATPAAALTGYGAAQDRIRALQAGFQFHIAKPVQPAELATVVATLKATSVRRG